MTVKQKPVQAEKKAKLSELLAVLEQCNTPTIQLAFERLGLGAQIALVAIKHEITIKKKCEWQRIGRGAGLHSYTIGNDATSGGALGIYCHDNGVTPPAGPPIPPANAANSVQIAPDLQPGQSTQVDLQ